LYIVATVTSFTKGIVDVFANANHAIADAQAQADADGVAAEREAASNVDHFHAQDTAKFASITTGLASVKTLLASQDSQAASELAKFMSMLADTKTTTHSRLDAVDASYDKA
jgi:hypothetical protein